MTIPYDELMKGGAAADRVLNTRYTVRPDEPYEHELREEIKRLEAEVRTLKATLRLNQAILERVVENLRTV